MRYVREHPISPAPIPRRSELNSETNPGRSSSGACGRAVDRSGRQADQDASGDLEGFSQWESTRSLGAAGGRQGAGYSGIVALVVCKDIRRQRL